MIATPQRVKRVYEGVIEGGGRQAEGVVGAEKHHLVSGAHVGVSSELVTWVRV